MKIAFVIPPVLDGTQDVDRCFGCNYSIYFLPLVAMLYPATMLECDGHQVAIRDFAARRNGRREFREFLNSDRSDLYCFYTVFLSERTDLLARDAIRAARPSARFLFYGPQPTWNGAAFAASADTFAVRGEPEFQIQRLVRALARGEDPGAILSGPAPIIEDLDTLPIPNRALLDHAPYVNPKLHRKPHTAMLTSRGCYAQCWYCVPNSLSYARELEYKRSHGVKPPVRMHSAGRVIEEFAAAAKLGFRSVSIIDDQFLWQERRTVEISEGIAPLKMEWSCLARADRVTERAAEAMARAGCAYVDLGAESFDQKVLDAVKKDIRVEENERAVRILKKCGITVELNVLIGATPEESEESIQKTLDEIARLDVDYALFSIANPFPGTEFYEAAKASGWLAYGDYVPMDPAKNAIISYPHLPKERLEQIVARAYRRHYLRPRALWRELRRTRSLSDLGGKVATGLKFIRRNFGK
jgi:anaerobic magnesium-protoporphyrin IX monomethyl ester cyclase